MQASQLHYCIRVLAVSVAQNDNDATPGDPTALRRFHRAACDAVESGERMSPESNKPYRCQ